MADNLENKEWLDVDPNQIVQDKENQNDASVETPQDNGAQDTEKPQTQEQAEQVPDRPTILPELGADNDEEGKLEALPEHPAQNIPLLPDDTDPFARDPEEPPLADDTEDGEFNPNALDQALEVIGKETQKLQKEIEGIREKEKIRLGNDFYTMMVWARRREKIQPLDDNFYAFEDAWKKALALVQPLQPYIDQMIYKDVLFSAALHYIICEPFEFEVDVDGEWMTIVNPLFEKHKIDTKAYIISSASDEGSSSSIHTTKSLNDGDFIMQDLLRTRYGTWVYSILEQLDIGATLL